jgi:hypothetical protein
MVFLLQILGDCSENLVIPASWAVNFSDAKMPQNLLEFAPGWW